MTPKRKKLEDKLKQIAGNAAFLSSEHRNLDMLSYFAQLKRQITEAEKLYMDLWKIDGSDETTV